MVQILPSIIDTRGARWVQNANVAERILEILPYLRAFCDHFKGKCSEATSKSYGAMKLRLCDKLLSAKLAFFAFIARKLETFLTTYQTDLPMVPFLYTDITALYITLASTIFKSQILLKSTKEIVSANPADITIQKSPRDADFGFSVKSELGKINDLTKDDKMNFRKECITFIVSLLQHLKQVTPVNSRLARGLSIFDPNVFKENGILSRLNSFLEEIVSIGWLSGQEADDVKEEFVKFVNIPSVLESAKEYRRDQRLDSFLLPLMQENGVSDLLSTLVRRVLVLSHGQATIERGFNVNKELLVENQHESSVIAHRIVYDAIRECDLKTIEISSKMLMHARHARTRYSQAQKDRRSEKVTKSQKALTKKRLQLEITEIEEEKKKLRTELEQKTAELDAQIADISNKLK